MSWSTKKNDVVVLTPFTYGNVLPDRSTQTQETVFLNYMTSRLRAALHYWTIHELNASAEWWLQGLRNEMVCKFFFFDNY
jgi:hypothetical protein